MLENRKKINIVADENMPLLDELFSDIANIIKLPGRSIKASDLASADVLLCRSITQVDQALLANTPVKFVGTATIGTDHLQIDWLAKQQISWANAAGCNAAAVAQYVISGICFWCKQHNRQLQDLTVGIVGAGNVGSELANCLTVLGVKFLMCDPPLARAGDSRTLLTLEQLKSCDVITFHVPLIKNGADKTLHLVDKAFLADLTEHQLIINAARGDIIDNHSLVNYLGEKNPASFILDVFENEPHIDFQLVQLCLLATPHIAGHTLEGKLRGSLMMYRAFCEFFRLNAALDEAQFYPPLNHYLNQNQYTDVMDCLLEIYDIQSDSLALKKMTESLLPTEFDRLRKNYVSSFSPQPRRDYSGWCGMATVPLSLSRLIGG